MRIAGIQNDSIVDGPGWRLTVFTQGCPHHCDGCHNPETWDFDSGTEITVDEIWEKYKSNPILSGITFSGGEPFISERYPELLELAQRVHKKGGNVWAYTGYVLEDLIAKERNNSIFNELLKNIDVIVDGKFEKEKRSISLEFRGSTNQRIIHLRNGEIL